MENTLKDSSQADITTKKSFYMYLDPLSLWKSFLDAYTYARDFYLTYHKFVIKSIHYHETANMDSPTFLFLCLS